MKYLFVISIGLCLAITPSCKSVKCVEKPCEGICTKEYNPVCGCNDKTYGNPCMAECHGITKYTMGKCKDEK